MTERRDDFAEDDRAAADAETPGTSDPAAPGDTSGETYPPAPAPEPEPYGVDTSQQSDAPAPLPWASAQGTGGDSWAERPAEQAPAHAQPWSAPRDRDSWPTTDAPQAEGTAAQPGTGAHPSPYDRWSPTALHAATLGSRPAGYPPSAPPTDFTHADYAAAPEQRYAWADVRGDAGPPNAYAPASAPSRPRRNRERRRVGLGVVVLLVLVALLAGIVAGALGGRALFPAAPASLPAGSSTAPPARAPESIAGIAAAALDSTVYIQVRGASSASSGSGMVLREDGYIVTNNHVIAPAAGGNGRVTVTFADGTEERAEIVGRTGDYDIAVLHVDRDGLTPLVLAGSDAVVVGDAAVAVGAPLGLEGTVTTGIISALNRPVQAGGTSDGQSAFINAIQTDAAINPGNSGGPLLNLAGEVVGINTAIAQTAGQETGSIGLGFAIPSDQVRRTAEQIIDNGHATYPVIGVALDTRYQGEGVQVLETPMDGTDAVTDGGPSDLAGIEAGDVITRFDGVPVTSPPELIVAVRSRAPGETVVLTVRSDGEEREVEIVLGEEVSD